MCARLLFPELFAAIHHKILRKFRHLFGRFDKTVVNPLFEKGFDTCDKVDAVIVAITGIVVFGTDYPAVETEFLERFFKMSSETAVAIGTEKYVGYVT